MTFLDAGAHLTPELSCGRHFAGKMEFDHCMSQSGGCRDSLDQSPVSCSDTLGVVRACTLGARPQTPVDRSRGDESHDRANHDSNSEAYDRRDIAHVYTPIAGIRQEDEIDGCDERQQTDDAPRGDTRKDARKESHRCEEGA